jgi:hypothetical protein
LPPAVFVAMAVTRSLDEDSSNYQGISRNDKRSCARQEGKRAGNKPPKANLIYLVVLGGMGVKCYHKVIDVIFR